MRFVRRFTPTYVGNISDTLTSWTPISVHPHIRGVGATRKVGHRPVDLASAHLGLLWVNRPDLPAITQTIALPDQLFGHTTAEDRDGCRLQKTFEQHPIPFDVDQLTNPGSRLVMIASASPAIRDISSATEGMS